jgi:proteasome lid subunit RPN8/RPN11
VISLPADIEAGVRAEGERSYPYECCGLILGTLGGPEGLSGARGQAGPAPQAPSVPAAAPPDPESAPRLAARLVPASNSREGEARRRRFSIEPRDFLHAEREALASGLEVLGVYHSHPDHPAAPSEHDLSQALPFYSYVIVSVRGGKSRELTSWRLSPDRGSFAEEEVGLSG